ncbi:MobF family relaxase [Chitinimonas sp. BJB300]|uniref:MobF family relaxase n=1 Tax=Chitinimonas sp. BJB300 TaxID=1559339 RepID=UPI000C11824F|nr:MobF family relaxase [Chitinimonas sp. BJB300]PHV12024.1 AAA family ATPase [Chitinimonas sp. BJB300]TSJ84935.1 conjugative relaxase [Chitinimonas sp. BJB300]
MMSCGDIIDPTKAAHYYSGEDDYYSAEGVGQWYGKGAADLGLSGEVIQATAQRLLEGELPNGQSIPKKLGGAVEHRPGLDFTLSAPKSVSMQALIGGDTAILEAHRQAVCEVADYLETLVVARTKQSGKILREKTNNMVMAIYDHQLSREKDPQLHSHMVVFNMTKRKDGKWRAIANELMVNNIKVMGAMYRSALAVKLTAMGYQLRATDAEGGFELAHISRDQLKVFSTRSNEVEAVLESRNKTRADASSLEKQVIALATRHAKVKLTVEDRLVLQQSWKEMSAKAGINYDDPRHGMQNVPAGRHLGAQEALQFAIEHLTERQAIMTESLLLTTALRRGVGNTSQVEIGEELEAAVRAGVLKREQTQYSMAIEARRTPELKSEDEWVAWLVEQKTMQAEKAQAYVSNAIAKGTLVQAEPRYTTDKAVQIECRILAHEFKGRNTLLPILSAAKAEKRLRKSDMNEGQRAAATMVLTTRNRITGIQGSAGVGKSHLMRQTTAEIEKAGYQVVLLAPYSTQAKRLQADGLNAKTLASFLASEKKTLSDKSVIVLDEAGLVPARQMEALLEVVEKYEAQIVLSGDVMQLKAIEAGRPFEQLQEAGMQTAFVTENMRQRNNPLFKEAVDFAAVGKTYESIAKLKNEVQEIEDERDRHARIAKDYASLSKEKREHTLVVTGTNSDRIAINKAIRVELGLEGYGRDFRSLGRRDMTQAQRKLAHHFRMGNVIQPERDYRQSGLERGQHYIVQEIEKHNQLRITSEDGREYLINPRQHAELSVYEQSRIELAHGDLVRITRNDAAMDIANGDRGKVQMVDGDQVHILLDNGHAIILDGSKPLHAEHAYVSTVHSSQGLTKHGILVDINTRSLTTSRENFYVAISRATDQVSIYTDSIKDLPKAIACITNKEAALDLKYKDTHYRLQ